MSKNVKVVPAILTDDPSALEQMARQAATFTDFVQIDIMDGRFVPSRSITRKQLVSLPGRLKWEAHLMVQDPGEYVADLKQAGASKVIFHHEATTSPREVILRSREFEIDIGLALNPETPVSAIAPYIDQVDSILLLTVTPGFYGSKFIPEVMVVRKGITSPGWSPLANGMHRRFISGELQIFETRISSKSCFHCSSESCPVCMRKSSLRR